MHFEKLHHYDRYKMCRVTDYCHTFTQCATKVVSNSLGLVGFAIGSVNSVLNFSAQLASEVFLGIQVTEQLLSKSFFGLVKMTFELVHADYSLPEWQASCKTDFLCTCITATILLCFCTSIYICSRYILFIYKMIDWY